MRSVIANVMMSLDGMFDGPGTDAERIDWFHADQEWFDYSIETLDQAGTLLFGRVTFDGMAAYWPHASDPVAERMNRLDKVGFSHSSRDTTWQNARWSTAAAGTINELRAQGHGNIVIMGSGNLVNTLTAQGLIDEYRVAINPVVLGAGTPLFPAGHPRIQLQRHDLRTFNSGIVEIRYRPTT